MKTSQIGIDLILKYEGFSATPYICSGGKATIGYGNTYYPDGTPVLMSDKPISKNEAILLFKYILKKFEFQVNKNIKVEINQNQFDVLVSHTYNTGGSNTLFKLINQKAPIETIKQWFETRYITANGKVLQGLINRRKSESELYFKL